MTDQVTHKGVIIYGPTASGKSDLALGLARRLVTQGRPAEIVSADAFQVFCRMNIGTAKASPEARLEVPHHLIDVRDPHDHAPFTVEDWASLAEEAIDSARRRGAVPIVVGGTSLYVQTLLFGMFRGPPADPGLRASLSGLGHAELRQRLLRADPAAAERIHPADLRRTVRALEVFHLTGRPISSLQTQWGAGAPRSDLRLFVLSQETPELNGRINARVRAMMERGLLEEVRGLLAHGPLSPQASQAIGYRQLAQHLANPAACPLGDAVERIKIETRRFAKSQRTWSRRFIGSVPGAMTISAGDQGRLLEATGMAAHK
ncbi:MAG: tRNA (adenosine(37)-N6)-dimethylallyltransferase MiaA [Isosphaera sp.]|nr:tRNA (adenosine(37)-N6)-dimethylallyltransferase MiaA [Isosphaera sp.]